jgi:nucleoside-diphosphate-sugar epimerase
MNKVVFLTGSTGFIGSCVIKILCDQGWTVRALVRDGAKAKRKFGGWEAETTGRIELIQGDLFAGSPADRAKLFRDCMAGAKAAIHLAEAKTREKDFDAKNIKTFGLLLEAAGGAQDLERFVFVSAFMAGGLPQPLPKVLTEEMTGAEFPDPYYQWKRTAERLLIKSSARSRFTYSIIRPALVYGPNAEWLVPMLSVIKKIGPYLVPLPNGGKALLGTVHVDDVASTIALSISSKAAENQIIHAVDNGGTTYADWIETICRASKRTVRIGKIPGSIVYALAKSADALTSLINLHFGAALWAQVLSDGCGYSNEKMKQIVGSLKNPTIREGIPGMMEWFSRTHA